MTCGCEVPGLRLALHCGVHLQSGVCSCSCHESARVGHQTIKAPPVQAETAADREERKLAILERIAHALELIARCLVDRA
jgi:hypothetical protein